MTKTVCRASERQRVFALWRFSVASALRDEGARSGHGYGVTE
ncbi:hypothetical protein RBWH47_03271 [Rhodopirellula baltica WH47]|uniref:Uncharacterized protein n=1 Tax=Rhodopirellula baltica WH47 TaxID=991778 RepID=F2AN58_RHOBT|nr:hypothetical protein RBWH47_03271 [Rhodopirellula baltica WH47]